MLHTCSSTPYPGGIEHMFLTCRTTTVTCTPCGMQLLLGMTRMRAAVMRGDYVWRLAVNTIRVNNVLDGPSKTSFLQFKPKGVLYYDNQLTASKILLIMGTYELWDNHTVLPTVSW